MPERLGSGLGARSTTTTAGGRDGRSGGRSGRLQVLPVGERVALGGRPPVAPRGGDDLDRAPGGLDRLAGRAAETPWTFTVSRLVSSPRPRTFTRPRLATRPRARSVAGLTSVPASKASSVSRLTTWYSTRKGLLKPLALGVRRCNGVWPPSNPGLIVSRAPWPLLPRPAVLPPLPPMPRAMRFGALPRAGGRLQVMNLHGDFLDSDEVRHLVEHAADHGVVVVLAARADAVEPERAQRAALLGLHADRRPHLGDLQLHHATSVISVFFALRSR